MTLRERLLRLLRVPHAPTPPAGDENVNVFHAAPNFLRYNMLKWALTNLGGLIGLWWALQFTSAIEEIPEFSFPFLWFEWTDRVVIQIVYLLEAGALLALIAQAVWSFLLLRLDFEQRWYIVTDRSLRIREGLVRLHEKTMTFANVQNVSVKQGPLQRLLGIANVEVRSAGGGSHDEPGDKDRAERHIAYFRGVDNAEAIRDAIRERLRIYRDAGLGDPDDVAPHDVEDAPREAASPLLESAQRFAEEARQLRLALTQ